LGPSADHTGAAKHKSDNNNRVMAHRLMNVETSLRRLVG